MTAVLDGASLRALLIQENAFVGALDGDSDRADRGDQECLLLILFARACQVGVPPSLSARLSAVPREVAILVTIVTFDLRHVPFAAGGALSASVAASVTVSTACVVAAAVVAATIMTGAAVWRLSAPLISTAAMSARAAALAALALARVPLRLGQQELAASPHLDRW